MFFEQRWYAKKSIYDIKKITEEHKITTVNELADFLFDKNKNGEMDYKLYNINTNNKPLTAFQKINTIWFFFLYWIVFAPYQYVKNGRIGFSQDKDSGKLVEKIIGQHFSSGKRSDYKAGWSKEISKKEFLGLMEKIGINTMSDFFNVYSSYNDYNFENDGFIIEKVSDIYYDKRMPIKRFNELWLSFILILLLPFVGTYRWFTKNDFGYDQNGKIIEFYKKKTQINE